jgi:multimeric flavodoxin WrbA
MIDRERSIRVLGLVGSPRLAGNTERLLDSFLAGAVQAGGTVEKVRVSRLTIAGCIACGGCRETGLCVVQDDFQRVDEKLVASDVIVLAAPLFFANLPAQVKSLVDRSQCQWVRKFLLHAPLPATVTGRTRRRGVFICVAGSSREEFKGAARTVKYFFDVYEADYWGELLLCGIDAKGSIDTRPEALQAAFNLGVKAVRE